MATSDAFVDALFEDAGILRAETLEELFATAALLANQPLPRGSRIAILTNAGGPAILAADACNAAACRWPRCRRRRPRRCGRSCRPTPASLIRST